MSRELVLELRHASVRYRKQLSFRRADHWALQDLSLQLYRGESVAVVGRNGSGKSTLLRLLAGIIAPDRGEVINYGVEVSLLALPLGFLPHLSGRDNIFLSGMLLGMRRREMARKLDEIIAFSELEERLDDPVRTYSAGMRARLGLAIALQLEPDVLLIDEVLAVGDARFRQKAMRAMREKIRAEGRTVVVVSHQLSLLRELCSWSVWLEAGTVRAQGRADAILTAYWRSSAQAKNHTDPPPGGRGSATGGREEAGVDSVPRRPPLEVGKSGAL